MFKSLWHALQEECSGAAAYQSVADISRYHRIQASPGFRQAAKYIHERLVQVGIQAEILTYPANTNTTFWGARSFQEWEAHAGTLHLIEPQDQARKLADYRETPISLIQRSVAFDGEVEVVAVEKGVEPAEYEGLNVAGKIVLARGSAQRVYDLAVRRRGAVGIVFDGMREVEPVRPAWALPDAIQYTSFWWFGDEPKCFGFALSPREGERLRRLIRKRQEEEAGPVRVRAHVDARLYDGTLEVVSATIPGESEEEIVLVSHLCHPQPSSNDNASGAAAVLEVARTLQCLVVAGKLPCPRRTLRFLWVPEMTGSYAFLASDESRIPHLVAGLNLDMVGQDQTQCGSSFILERPPDALPSFAPDLLIRLREMLFPEADTHTKLGAYPLFRHSVTPFSGGSDHHIFSDPSVGVPMPMIIQWPDRFYHTTADTPDKVDPAMLGKTCVLAAAYTYWLAQAGEAETRWLASEMSARLRQRIITMVQEARTNSDEEDGPGKQGLRRWLDYQVERHQEALVSLTRLAPIDDSAWRADAEAFADAEFNRVADVCPQGSNDVAANEEAAHLIPRRMFRGPLWLTGHVSCLDAAGRDRWWTLSQRIDREASHTVPELAVYWADGRRSVAEIGQRVALETGLDATALLVEYFHLVQELGLLELERAGG
jgi:aminopeptidase YwaD